MEDPNTIVYGGEIYFPIGNMQYINYSRTLILDLTPESRAMVPYLRRMIPYVATIIIGVAGLLYISV